MMRKQTEREREIAQADILDGTLAGMKPHEDTTLITEISRCLGVRLVLCSKMWYTILRKTRLLVKRQGGGTKAAKPLAARGMLFMAGCGSL